MKTSTVIYVDRDCKKARQTIALVRDAEYQLALRAIRKGESPPIFGKWRNCRAFPGLWELTTEIPTMPIHEVSLKELQADERIDQKVLRLACG